MEKYFKMSYLIDIYSALLTEKQVKVLEYYYEDDMSLSEIAHVLSISRQGVHDTLKRAEKVIEEYDDKLKLLDKYEKNLEKINEIYSLTNNQDIIKKLDDIKENL